VAITTERPRTAARPSATVPRRRQSRARAQLTKFKHGPFWWIGYILLLAWTVVTLLPFISMLLLSFHPTSDIYAHPLGLTGTWEVQNYIDAWSGGVGGSPIVIYLINSCLVAILSIAIAVSFGTLAGYGLARMGAKLGAGISRFMILALSIPLVVALIPVFQLMGSLHLLNTVLGISLVYAAFSTPTVTLIMRSVFGGVPIEIIEAAKVDGCNELTALWRVILPIVRGGLISVSLLCLIFVWAEVQFAVVLLSRPQNLTLAVGLLSFQGQFVSDQGAFFAGLVIATAPVVILFVIFQRYITKGVTLGAVK
jgi:ABC-type glycerol-3-phosphate transport system permease component